MSPNAAWQAFWALRTVGDILLRFFAAQRTVFLGPACQPDDRSREISTGFTEAERQRFHNLLQLAAESPFEGERANALAADTRLAVRCGQIGRAACRERVCQ